MLQIKGTTCFAEFPYLKWSASNSYFCTDYSLDIIAGVSCPHCFAKDIQKYSLSSPILLELRHHLVKGVGSTISQNSTEPLAQMTLKENQTNSWRMHLSMAMTQGGLMESQSSEAVHYWMSDWQGAMQKGSCFKLSLWASQDYLFGKDPEQSNPQGFMPIITSLLWLFACKLVNMLPLRSWLPSPSVLSVYSVLPAGPFNLYACHPAPYYDSLIPLSKHHQD